MKKMFIGFLITLGVLGASLAFNTKTVLAHGYVESPPCTWLSRKA